MAVSSANLQWTVSSQSKHIDESLLFLEYITRLENSEAWVKLIQGFVTRKGAVNENTAEEEMVAIAGYLESHNVVPLLEVFFSQEVIQSGHWAGSNGILSGQITTEEWAALIQEMSDASELVPLE
jgi:ABC-type glycerol-3-phosphate transport system substrate-binding protein